MTINEIASAVYGTYRLAKRDPGGLDYLDRSSEGAVKSFYAAVIVLPIHAVLTTASKWEFLQKAEIPTWFAFELVFYVIGWTLFPVLMITITRWIDRWNRFPDFLVAYNWSHIIILAAWLPLQFLRLTELVPMPVFHMLGLGLLVIVLYYRWFFFKVSLDITGGMAAALVASDYVLGLVMFQVSESIVYGE